MDSRAAAWGASIIPCRICVKMLPHRSVALFTCSDGSVSQRAKGPPPRAQTPRHALSSQCARSRVRSNCCGPLFACTQRSHTVRPSSKRVLECVVQRIRNAVACRGGGEGSHRSAKGRSTKMRLCIASRLLPMRGVPWHLTRGAPSWSSARGLEKK